MFSDADLTDNVPLIARKLRRRPNDPVFPVPQEKRRKPPPSTSSYYMLQDQEINEDLKAMQPLASAESANYQTNLANATVNKYKSFNSASIRKPG